VRGASIARRSHVLPKLYVHREEICVTCVSITIYSQALSSESLLSGNQRVLQRECSN
jgi:hypothetical protein